MAAPSERLYKAARAARALARKHTAVTAGSASSWLSGGVTANTERSQRKHANSSVFRRIPRHDTAYPVTHCDGPPVLECAAVNKAIAHIWQCWSESLSVGTGCMNQRMLLDHFTRELA